MTDQTQVPILTEYQIDILIRYFLVPVRIPPWSVTDDEHVYLANTISGRTLKHVLFGDLPDTDAEWAPYLDQLSNLEMATFQSRVYDPTPDRLKWIEANRTWLDFCKDDAERREYLRKEGIGNG
jgi:hypothetical protein